jgi:hypothetical protein
MAELKSLAITVEHDLSGFAGTAKHTEAFQNHPDSDYYLLILDAAERSYSIRGFRREELGSAYEQTALAEADGFNAVLVSTDSLANLWKSYPNYFLDLNALLKSVRTVINAKI